MDSIKAHESQPSWSERKMGGQRSVWCVVQHADLSVGHFENVNMLNTDLQSLFQGQFL